MLSLALIRLRCHESQVHAGLAGKSYSTHHLAWKCSHVEQEVAGLAALAYPGASFSDFSCMVEVVVIDVVFWVRVQFFLDYVLVLVPLLFQVLAPVEALELVSVTRV